MSERDRFLSSRAPSWERLDALLRTPRHRTAAAWQEFATLYRTVCADLARAQALELPDDVVSYLDRLASRAHNRLYRRTGGAGRTLFLTALLRFPRVARREWRFLLAAHLFFYGPFLFGVVGPLVSPDFAGSILPAGALDQFEVMYGDVIGRTEGQNAQMAGFYVWNNVGIALRCFATGALAGLGSVFYLVYNGLILGTVTGFLISRGLGLNLLTFTASHTPWELTGIAVAGAAGLRLGYALIVTEGLTRIGSLRAAAPSLFALVIGAAALLFVAALIEGFWSAGAAPLWVKLIFSAAGVAVIIGWIGFAGRDVAP